MFEYYLSDEEISQALKQGGEYAQIAIKKSPRELKESYDLVKTCTGQLLENFDPEKFHRRENKNLSESRLRNLILSAFTSVQAANEMSTHIQPPSTYSGMDIGEETTRQIQLFRAVTMFRTNGASDDPALDVAKTFEHYQTMRLQAV